MLLDLLRQIRRNWFFHLMIFLLLLFFSSPISVKAVNFSALLGSNSIKKSMLASIINFGPIPKSIMKSAGFAGAAYLLGRLTYKCFEAVNDVEEEFSPFWVGASLAGLVTTCAALGLSTLNLMPSALLNKSSTPTIAAAKTAGFCMIGLLSGYLLKKNAWNRIYKDKDPHWKRSVISLTICGLCTILAARHAIDCFQLMDPNNNLWKILVG